MSYFPPPASPAPPVRCYEDGSCDGQAPNPVPNYPPPSPDSYITPATATPPGPRYDVDAEDRAALLAAMQYGMDQRRPQLRGLWGGG
jgi:hypothetical protein